MADAQHGVVARTQLVDLGLTDDEVDYRIAVARLHHVHRGVFAVGRRALSLRGRWMAAVLAGGSGAVLSHRAAAALHGILPPDPGRIDVTVPRALHGRPSLAFHCAALPLDETDRLEGIPVTGVSRTILDLAVRGDLNEIRRALHEAEVKGLTDRLSLLDLIDRYPRRPGVARIRAALAERRVGNITRSELEERFLAFLDARGLPQPEINALIPVEGGRLEVDCLWRHARLVVELDGRGTHDTVRAFERDRIRDRQLNVAGWRPLRVTWRQLEDDPDRLEADLRRLTNSTG